MEGHSYYWAWSEEDNKDCDFRKPAWYRVFKAEGKGMPVTEPMSKEEAIDYCNRVVKLTGGRQI